jgi:GGDEF domain-containing protein
MNAGELSLRTNEQPRGLIGHYLRRSIGIGIAIYPEDGRTAAELIEAADRQLYNYKRTENRRTLSQAGRDLNSKRVAR